MLTWMPRTRSRCISPTVVVTAEPQSPPCAPKRSYPSRLISVAHACRDPRRLPRPRVDGLLLNPYPGSDGHTTWNASAASPPCATGSVKGPSTSRNSTTEPGQPWVMTSGTASGSGERACTKWMSRSSIRVVNCGHAFIRSWAAAKSYSSAQYVARSRTNASGIPCDQSSTVSRSGHRVFCSLARRSSIASRSKATRKGMRLDSGTRSSLGACENDSDHPTARERIR